jgi:hypothetical protein
MKKVTAPIAFFSMFEKKKTMTMCCRLLLWWCSNEKKRWQFTPIAFLSSGVATK